MEIQKRQRENDKYFADRAIGASGAGKTGYAKDVAEINKEIASHTQYVDDKGVSHFVPLSKAAIASIMDEATKKFDAFKEHVATRTPQGDCRGRQGHRGGGRPPQPSTRRSGIRSG